MTETSASLHPTQSNLSLSLSLSLSLCCFTSLVGFGLVSGGKQCYTGKLYAIKALDKARVKKSKAEDLCWAERKALGKPSYTLYIHLSFTN